MATSDGDLEASVRARLRQLRFERGLTLAQAAARAGMSASALSRLESGARGLGVTRLARLAGALDVGLGDLVGAPASGDPAPAADGRRWWPVIPETPDGLRAYRVRLPPGPGEPELSSHEGFVLLVVLVGLLRLVTPDSDEVLGPGEATAFATWTPHGIAAVDEPVDLVAVFSPAGAPIRLRAAP